MAMKLLVDYYTIWCCHSIVWLFDYSLSTFYTVFSWLKAFKFSGGNGEQITVKQCVDTILEDFGKTDIQQNCKLLPKL